MRTKTPRTIGWMGAAASVLASVLATAGPAVALTPASPRATSCPASRWAASWTASPTDGSVFLGPSLDPVPTSLTDQTIRMVITPHLGGTTLRLRLSNRFGTNPVAFGHVSIAPQTQG